MPNVRTATGSQKCRSVRIAFASVGFTVLLCPPRAALARSEQEHCNLSQPLPLLIRIYKANQIAAEE